MLVLENTGLTPAWEAANHFSCGLTTTKLLLYSINYSTFQAKFLLVPHLSKRFIQAVFKVTGQLYQAGSPRWGDITPSPVPVSQAACSIAWALWLHVWSAPLSSKISIYTRMTNRIRFTFDFFTFGQIDRFRLECPHNLCFWSWEFLFASLPFLLSI